MQTMIEGYRSFPGDHCGSVAMRGLFQHYCDLALPEGAVFGLGSGLECMLIQGSQMDPGVTVFGRTGRMEVDAASALGVDYREQTEPDDERAWQLVREEVLAGRPTMLSGDILYLDYREFKVHFPAHRFVLLGFDDGTEKAFIADRIREEAEACSYGALRKSRNPPEGLSTVNLWGRFHGTEVGRSLAEATQIAISRCAHRMLGTQNAGDGEHTLENALATGNRLTCGIEGIEEFARVLPDCASREDATWIASFNARCIEKFGNGGGNFRRLYADFLAWAREGDPKQVPEGAPSLAMRAAEGWTEISQSLARASEEGAGEAPWREASRHAARVAEIERQLFTQLADCVG